MRTCVICGRPLRVLAEWKGRDGRFYCSEFCAEAADTRTTPASARPLVARRDSSRIASENLATNGARERTRIHYQRGLRGPLVVSESESSGPHRIS